MKIIAIPWCLMLTACITVKPTYSDDFTAGKELAFARHKGNCLACHEIENGESAGNIGPKLINLSARFNNKQQLREQIWDATVFNPKTSMPPFGRNKILTATEIDQVVEYLWSLSEASE